MKLGLRPPCACISLLLLALSVPSQMELTTWGTNVRLAAPSSLGHYEGSGIAAPLFWTGDGNRINNTSFETGSYQPWVPIQSNALTTAAQMVQQGYEGASSLRLALVSGNFSNNNFWEPGEPVLYDNNANGIYDAGEAIIKGPTPTLGSLLTHDPFIKFNDANTNSTWDPSETVIVDTEPNNSYSQNDIVLAGTPPALGTGLMSDDKLAFVDQNADSYYSLLSDLTRQQVGFEVSLRLRAAIFVESITGTTQSDRTEVSTSLTTSLGSVLTIHYIVSPNSGIPSNTASDAYYRASSLSSQWVSIDRNVPLDAQQAFTSIFPSINSVKEVRLSELSRTQPLPTDDPKIKYVDTNIDNFWEVGESLVYDANSNSQYDTGDQVLSGPLPAIGTPLKDDPKIKFVDSNNDSTWNTGSPGESIIYDKNSNGQYDEFVNGETVVYGSRPTRGTLLQRTVHETTQSLFDRIELYSATGNYDWVRNGAFTSGLSAWTTGGFTTSPSVFNQTSPSASGTRTNGAAELVQSIDGRPRIESWVNFKAAVRIGVMSGTSRNDTVDILLGMVDSRGYALSLYYAFRTGDLSLPTNDTDTIYIRANGFGLMNQWISLNRNLTQDTRDFSSLLGFIPPFRIELLALEVASSASSATTTAFFDDISIYQPYKYGQAASHFYANPATNSTYLFTASNISQGTFYLDVPRGQAVLNITAPDGLAIGSSAYSVQVDNQADTRRITIPSATMFNHSPQADWFVYTTSTNSLTKLYVEDPVKKTENSTLSIGATANLVSRSIDPLARPIIGGNLNITLWNNATQTITLTRTGLTDTQGWFNVTGVNPAPGTYVLRATSLSAYVGVAEYALLVKYILTVSLSISSNQVPAGTNIIVSGGVAPSTPGIAVTLYYRLAGDIERTQLATVMTDSNGRYSYTWTPAEGDYEITAAIGNSTTTSAESSPQVVFVGPPDNQLVLLLAIAGVIAAVGIVALVLFRRNSRGLAPSSTPTL